MIDGEGNPPDVSVIVAAWSAEAFIAPAIQSALQQGGVSLDVIVIDDASPDDTMGAALTAAAGDPRLHTVRMETNGGPAAARNRGIEIARGRYLAVLDADDTFEPGRLEALVKLADKSGADIVADNMNEVVLPALNGARPKPFLKQDSVLAHADISLSDYLDPASAARFGNELGYLKPLFRTETLARTGLRYDLSLRNSEDFYLVACLLAEGASMLISPICGYNYSVREGSISYRLTVEQTAAILDADRAFEDRYGAKLQPAEQRALRHRRRRLTQWDALQQVVEGLKARRPQRVLSAAMSTPTAVPFIAARLASIGWQKLVA